MRKIFVALALVVALAGSAAATLYIQDFDVDLTLTSAGEFQVVESITVVFLTPHHGIDRWIPVSYRTPQKANLTIDFRLDRVDIDGSAVPYVLRRSGPNQTLRIGDPDRTITGTHVYGIAYTVDRVLIFGEQYLQLYWNVTGNEWEIPITQVHATLTLPGTVSMELVQSTTYVGYKGSETRGNPAEIQTSSTLLFQEGNLNPGEGLTIDVAIPRSVLPIAPPSFGERAFRFVADNLLALLPIATFVGMLVLWFRVGRDPRKGIVAPAFEPPRDLGPGEAGVLFDDRADLRDVSAMLIGLAVGGYLSIREDAADDPGLVDRLKSLAGVAPSVGYVFVRSDKSADALSPAERALYDALFPDAEQKERTLASLENAFYKHLPVIKLRLYDELIRKGFYPHNPERTRSSYAGLATFLLVGGVAIGIWLQSPYLGIVVALSGLVVLAFSPFMPRKTRKGVDALVELLGLAEYIERAEVKRMEFHDAPAKSPERFEKLLPYAVAMNLTSIWVRQFEDLLTTPPNWYAGPSVFRSQVFALSMMRLSSGMERAFVSVPRSASTGRSAWGGRASFGGGFSGGGFGGGGGRGW